MYLAHLFQIINCFTQVTTNIWNQLCYFYHISLSTMNNGNKCDGNGLIQRPPKVILCDTQKRTRPVFLISCNWLVSYKGYQGPDLIITMTSQITNLTIVYSIVYSDADQRKHQSSASLAFVWGIHWGPVNFPHKWPVTWKIFPFHDVIMMIICHLTSRGLFK